jgi:lipoprotein-anchoring transpeptidase ErfK/SrfK
VLRRLAVAVACACALSLGLGACAGGGDDGKASGARPAATTATTVAPATTTAAPANQSFFVTVKSTVPQIAIYDQPNAANPSRTLDNPWLYDPKVPTSKVPQVFLVEQQRKDGWIQVLLPVRPNGSTGWVKADDVTLTANPYRIDVSLGAHTITVRKAADVIYTGPVAVGATNPPLPDVGKPTPTPTGEYYLRILLQAPDPNTVYGPYAYGLSSHSESLEEFAGSDAEIGIHGNNDASVLGSNATHGCIRMDNAAITMLAKQLPLGTPVLVAA